MSARWVVAAMRHRPGQTVGVLVLAFLVGACVVLIRLATRSLEQGVVKPAVTLRPAVASALIVDAGLREAPASEVGQAAELLGPVTRRVYPRGVGNWAADGLTQVFPEPAPSNPAQLLVRDDVCAHLRFSAGRCPTAAGEIAVSESDSDAYGWRVGTTRPYAAPTGSGDPRRGTRSVPSGPGQPAMDIVQLTVVGVYVQAPDDRFWLGRHLGGNRAIVQDQGVKLDPWVAAPATVRPGWVVSATREYAVDPLALTIDDLPAVQREIGAAQERAPSGAVLRGGVAAAGEEVASSAAQIRLIVPLVLGQLAALVVAVLYAVARSAADERRGEAALARLRGGGARGARRLLLGELLPPVLVGVVLGGLGAVGIGAGLRARILPPGVPAEIGPSTGVAVLAAALVAGAVVALAAWPVVRLDVFRLLQRLPVLPRGIGAGTWVVLALTAAAVLALRTTSDPTPLALAAPTLLALALGLLGAGLLGRLGPAVARRARRRGAAGAALGWAAAARRPVGRLVAVIVAVATASTVVAANAAVVGARNRQLRAELESGAPYAVQVGTADLPALVDLVQRADPAGEKATVVAVTRPADGQAPATLAVDPRQLGRVAYTSTLPGADLDRLSAGERPPSLRVAGSVLALTGTTDLTPLDSTAAGTPGTTPGPAPGETPAADDPVWRAWGLRVGAVVTTPDGRRLDRPLGVFPLRTTAPTQLSAPLLCQEACRFDRLTFALAPLPGGTPGAASQASTGSTGSQGSGRPPAMVRGRVTLTGLTVDGRRVGLGPAGAWRTWRDPVNPAAAAVEVVDAAAQDSLALSVTVSGGPVAMPYGDVPDPLPGLVVGVDGTTTVEAKGLTDTMLPIRPIGTGAGQLPLLAARGILVDRTVLGLRGAHLGPNDTAEVWFAGDSDGTRAAVRDALAARGMAVTGVRDAEVVRARYDASGSAWGLSLALVAAALSMLVAVAFVVVAALLGWRRAATDAAVLRMAGMRARTVRAAAVRERVIVSGAGVLLGALAGVLGAFLVMPLFPLFTRPAARPLPALLPDPPAVALSWCLVALAVTAAATGSARLVARRARARLVEEEQ